ncbi:hypothetical protein AB0I28_05650 [Phytomonospora sp. NPDC050363]|uniref:hypothetical protein n=1 Tax=Phytomonospora sp. NPDC050363 TaxID=3155642 RepID=UPI0033E22A65
MALLLVIPMLAAVMSWGLRGPSAEIVAGAAGTLAEAPAVTLAYSYVDPTGLQSDGTLTVTADGYATGTMADEDTGVAAFVVTPEATAVYGDEDWWLRRAPDRVSAGRDRWVSPSEGTAFPVDIAAALTPSAVGDLVSAVADGGELTDEGDAVDGRPVVTVRSGGWTLLLTTETPRRVVWLGGPVESGKLHPAGYTGSGSPIVPLGLDGDAGVEIRQVEGESGGGYLSMSPEPADSSGADKAKTDASGTMSGKGTTPSGMATPSAPSAPGEAPPEVEKPTTLEPAFTVDYAFEPVCASETCSWSATVTNTGTAPGHTHVTLIESPGGTSGPHDLGVLQPGQSGDASKSHRNQAIGTGGSVTVSFTALPYAVELHGDQDRFNRLVDKGFNGDNLPPLLDGIEGKYLPDVLKALDQMTDDGVPVDTAATAVKTAREKKLLPDLRTLAQADGRLEGLGVLANKLGKPANPSAMQGTLGEFRAIARVLRDPTVRKVEYEGVIDNKRSDLLIERDSGNQAVQIKTIAGNKLAGHINDAVNQLNGKNEPDGKGIRENAPDGYEAVVWIDVALEKNSEFYFHDEEEFEIVLWNELQLGNIDACKDRDEPLRFDRLIIRNGSSIHDSDTGVYEWTREEVCG